MGYGLDIRGSILARSKTFFCTPQGSDSICPHPVSYPTDTEIVFQGVKRPGREAEHSPSSSAKDNNGGAILPLFDTPSGRGTFISRDNFACLHCVSYISSIFSKMNSTQAV
jgi:hypothetical protein